MKYLSLLGLFCCAVVAANEGLQTTPIQRHACIAELSQLYVRTLTAGEACTYAGLCDEKNKVELYCQQLNLSECFEEKAWKNKAALLEPFDNKNIRITPLRRGTNSACAYYE